MFEYGPDRYYKPTQQWSDEGDIFWNRRNSEDIDGKNLNINW